MGYFVDVSLGGPTALIGLETKDKKSDGSGQRDALVGVLDRKTVVIWNIAGESGEPLKIPGWQVPILYEQFAAILFPEREPDQTGPCKFYGRRIVSPSTP